MHVRVVRFTGVTPERIDALLARVREEGGPPEGVSARGISFVYDETAGTAVVIQRFDTAEDMAASAKVLEAMDSGETPGTRASVDAGEMVLELEA